VVLEGECREVFANAQILEDVGLDVPQITKLAMLLRQKGIELDPSVYTVEEAFEKIIELYK
jgi:hypothetical protein